MKNKFRKIGAWMGNHKVASTFIIVVVIIVAYFAYGLIKGSSIVTTYQTAKVRKGNIVLSISGTGQVEADNQVDLKVKGTGGPVTNLKVTQGQMVEAGQIIAVIDDRSLYASLVQARASLGSAKANYQKLVNGATVQDVQISKTSVDTAKVSLNSAARDAYLKVEDAVRNKIDVLFKNPETVNPLIIVRTQTDAMANDINTSRLVLSEKLNNTKADLSTDKLVTDVGDLLDSSKTFMDKLGLIVNVLSANNTGLTQAQIDNYRATVNSASQEISSTIDSLVSAKSSLESANNNLNLKVAPPRSEDVTSAQSQLDSAEASLLNAQNNYDDSIIKAPFAGQVAALNVSLGDVVDSSTVVASVITKEKIAKISLNEIDTAKIALGDKVKLSFDALPNLSLDGQVVQIDNIGTVAQGVVSYVVKISFNTDDQRIKVGMSVSSAIIGDERTGVLIVPSSATSSYPSSRTLELNNE
ncbi:MAG: HlyD family efflux transporter periplasmic adaptor subunit [Candidatus Taylorbacteria bacterium]|nr:HlyD family efflux transporter periplasmic adaptor subunit [Candidatus Taylorbacteria bacterium]